MVGAADEDELAVPVVDDVDTIDAEESVVDAYSGASAAAAMAVTDEEELGIVVVADEAEAMEDEEYIEDADSEASAAAAAMTGPPAVLDDVAVDDVAVKEAEPVDIVELDVDGVSVAELPMAATGRVGSALVIALRISPVGAGTRTGTGSTEVIFSSCAVIELDTCAIAS